MRHILLVLAFGMTAVGLLASADAGVFVYQIRSTQIQVDPPRYRSVIGFFDRYDVPLYGVRTDTSTYGGTSPVTRILEASGPSWMHASVDPVLGTATWTCGAVPNYRFNDSLEVVTDTPNPCFWWVYLGAPQGLPVNKNYQCSATDQVTEVRFATWGQLKSLYR